MYPSKSVVLGFLLGIVFSPLFISVIFPHLSDSISDEDYNTPDNYRSVSDTINDTSLFNSEQNSLVLSVIRCKNKEAVNEIKRRGKYWVFYNFVRAEKTFACHESITLTTPADFRFLDNLQPLAEIWQGPISVALYTPGDDFRTTLTSIAYLRNCLNSTLIRELVTFHVFFEDTHIPKTQDHVALMRAYSDSYLDCDGAAPFAAIPDQEMYKTMHNLTYPINVARNIARETALTHFIFPSDIELFPIPNFVAKFFEMVVRKRSLFLNKKRRVFVLPVFEIEADQTIPRNKTVLQEMLKNKTAIVFHAKICIMCHRVINSDQWIRAKESSKLDVMATGKRYGNFKFWEPFYIGTNQDPLFDERLSWEGQGNKMSQAYSLCILDYDFMILDNAFLIHKPGIKKNKFQILKHKKLVATTNKKMLDYKKELDAVYGGNKYCKICDLDR